MTDLVTETDQQSHQKLQHKHENFGITHNTEIIFVMYYLTGIKFVL